jgi:cobalt-zinc-cadmium efflux system outer membrane protein
VEHSEIVPEEAPSEPRAYTLDALLALVDQSPAMIAAQDEIARATGVVVQGDLIPNPVLRLEAEMMPIDDIGFGNSRNKVVLSQRFETAGKADARVNAALLRQKEAQALYYRLREEARAQTAKDFYWAAYTRSKIESTKRMLMLKEGLLEQARALSAQGRLPELEVIPHEVALEETRAALKSLEGDERSALRAMEGRLGLDGGTILACRMQERIWSPPKEAREALLSRSPELVWWDRRLEAAHANREAQGTMAYPDVTAGLGYMRGEEMGEGRDDFMMAFLQVPLPLFDRNQGSTQSAEAEIRKAESELLAAAYRVLDAWQGRKEQWEHLRAKRDLYYDRIIPLLEKDLALRKDQEAVGRLPVQERLEAALALEEAVLSAIDQDGKLAALRTEMALLLGGDEY